MPKETAIFQIMPDAFERPRKLERQPLRKREDYHDRGNNSVPGWQCCCPGRGNAARGDGRPAGDHRSDATQDSASGTRWKLLAGNEDLGQIALCCQSCSKRPHAVAS